MLKQNQTGAINGLAVSLVLAILLLIGAIAFGGWAYTSRQDYKDHTDTKISAAVTVAKQQEGSLKDAEFKQAEKNPLKTYNGPEAYGSLAIDYPKTWSGYVDIANNGSGSSNSPVNGYFYPGVVPSVGNESSVFALRAQVLSQSYSQVLQTFSSLQQSKNPPSISPYALPKVPKTVGVMVKGQLPNNKTGIMVILPLRSQTLELWTEGSQFTGDFNNIILPNASFSP